MRLERILNLLIFLLTTKRPATTDEIRMTVAGYDPDNDDAFRRMFERDKEFLRGMGIPIHLRSTGVFELEQGYVIPPDDYRLRDPGLTDQERAALLLAAQVIKFGGVNPGTEALLKLGGASAGDGYEPYLADLGGEVDLVSELYQGVVDRRVVSFRYRDKERRVQPHGLGHRQGHWYLAAVEGDEERVFRVDRMESVHIGKEADAFRRTPGVSVRRAMSGHPWEQGDEPPVAVVVRFDESAAWWAERRLEPSVMRRPLDGGGFEATLEVSRVDAFIGWVLAFENEAEVISPPVVRQAVIDRVKGLT